MIQAFRARLRSKAPKVLRVAMQRVNYQASFVVTTLHVAQHAIHLVNILALLAAKAPFCVDSKNTAQILRVDMFVMIQLHTFAVMIHSMA